MADSTYQKNAHANKVMSEGIRALSGTLSADKRYGNLSLATKCLYSLMLDRVWLSERNGWRDEDGRPFICFSAREAARLVGVSETTARRMFRQLESLELLRREKQGQGRPDRLFVRTFDTETPEPRA